MFNIEIFSSADRFETKMLKQRPINIAETNLALFGTDLERKIKEESAKHEDAWKGAGQTPYG
jgi:gelsolin